MAFILCVSLVDAGTKTWNTTAGDWFDDGNWDPIGVPAAGDDVQISGTATAVLSASTPTLGSFTIGGGATLLFTNSTTAATWLNATSVVVQVDGNLSHAAWPEISYIPDMSGQHGVRVHADTLLVESGAAIDVSACGYPGQVSDVAAGWGPGAGRDPLVGHSSGGAGHGGMGGRGYTGFMGRGGVYDDPETPILAGSSACGGASGLGGSGGGVVQIEAGSVNLLGGIKANGGDGSGSHGGGGAGGSVFLDCTTITGDGTLEAIGGNRSGEGGQGGGGRIAVHYDEALQASVSPAATLTFKVQPGAANVSSFYLKGEYGSLYVTDQTLLGSNPLSRLTFRTDTTGLGSQTMGSVKIYSSNSLVFPGMALASNQRLGFVDIPGGVRIEGDVTLETRSELYIETTGEPLTITGNVTLSGNPPIFEYGFLRVAAPATLADPSVTATNLYVQGDIVVQNGGKLRTVATVYTNSGVARVVCDGLVDVDTGGEFSALGAGYAGSPGNGYAFGPGPGFYDGVGGSGGGHGGAGGNGYFSSTHGGITNDVAEFPMLAGSGGGGPLKVLNNFLAATNSVGGGVLWLKANKVRNNGEISANAPSREELIRSGGGAGGSLLIEADCFESGTGIYSANGANGGQHAGGGGGGRMALRNWSSFLFDGPVTASGGACGVVPGSATAGADGTVVIEPKDLPDGCNLVVVGEPLGLGVWTPYAYGLHRVSAGVYTNTTTEFTTAVMGARNRFIGWALTNETGVVDSGSTLDVVMDMTTSGLTLIASWTNQWELTTSASVGGSIDDDPAGWYDQGISVSLTPIADSGFLFISWAGEGVPDGMAGANPLQVTMDQARDIQAVFASETPTARSWLGGSGNWVDSTNWDPNGVPGPNDTTTITNGTVTISDSMQVASLTLGAGGTLLMKNWDTQLTLSGSLIIDNGGVLTHEACGMTADPLHRIRVSAASIEVRSGGTVNADELGYLGGTCIVSGTGVSGYGPGGGMVKISGFGGSHGGIGGVNNHGGTVPVPYDDASMPSQPGSGGGSATTLGSFGGTGGGVIYLEASGSLIVNGTVTAAGGSAGIGNAGGGAGGTVYLICRTIEGSGSISVGGGERYGEGGSGGGGRIAVHYDVAAQSALTVPSGVKLGGAVYDNGISGRYHATLEQGCTLWLPDNELFSGVLSDWLIGTVQYLIELDLEVPQLDADGVRMKLCATNSALDVFGSVSITNTGEIAFADTGNLTVGGNVSVAGTRSVLSLGTFNATNGGVLSVSGDLNVANGGKVSYRFPVSQPDAFQVGGAIAFAGTDSILELIAAPGDDPALTPGGILDWSSKDLVIPEGGMLRVVSDGISGASVWLRFRNLAVEAGGVISADGAGYYGGWSGHRNGYGPGFGSDGVNSGGGGGYGGAGGKGNHSDSYGGVTYGDEERPLLPGSGGAVSVSSGEVAPTFLTGGGGLIAIESHSLTVNGTLSANGAYSSGSHPGGASGGGIYIRTHVLAGSATGLLTANGRSAPSAEAGAGGGGRIAIWSIRNDWVESTECVQVLNGTQGTASRTTPALPGTVFWGELYPAGTVIFIR